MEKVSEAQKRATRKYVDEKYDRLELKFRKDEKWKERIDEHCKQYGYVSNTSRTGLTRMSFIKNAIETQMAIERGEIKIVKVDVK